MARDSGAVRRSKARAIAGRRRPGAARRQSETRRAILILSAAGAAILMVGVALFVGRTPTLDLQSGCVAGQLTPASHTVVLIDQTDPLTPAQIAYAKTLILAEYERLSPQGRLTIRSIRPSSDNGDADADPHAFSRCRVRRGSEVSDLVSNPDMIEAVFRRTVGVALNDYLNGLRKVPSAPRSPIMEAVAATLDSPDFGATVKARRLVLISDMAQNTALLSQYHGPGSGLVVSPGVQESLSRDMHGVVVRVHYIRRPELAAIQTSQQRAFWRDWFQGQGAQAKLGWGLQLTDSPSRPGR